MKKITVLITFSTLTFFISGIFGSGFEWIDWPTFSSVGMIGVILVLPGSFVYLILYNKIKSVGLLKLIYLAYLAFLLVIGIISQYGELHAPILGFALIPTVTICGVFSFVITESRYIKSNN